MLNKDQIIKELWWEIQEFGFDPEDEKLRDLLEVAYDKLGLWGTDEYD